jgi:repressor LexA
LICSGAPGEGDAVMLTRKQHELLMFIHQRIQETGVSPSFDEMKEALDLASKSGIHRLITALEERGFVHRLAHRARALEVLKLPQTTTVTPFAPRPAAAPSQSVQNSGSLAPTAANDTRELPILGKIAAGTAIAAIQIERGRLQVPEAILGRGEHYVLEVEGDSMIHAGIFNGDYAIIRKADTGNSGEIVVALVMKEEATLKRLRKRGASIALEAANPAYETRIYGPDQVEVQGKLVALIRRYQ